MTLLDIISLAKAGYKKADIDKWLAMPIDEPEPEPQPDNSTEPENGSKGDPEPSPEPSADDPDYKKMYTDILEQFETLKNDLKAAQEQNRRADNSGNDPDPMDDLADVFRSYM